MLGVIIFVGFPDVHHCDEGYVMYANCINNCVNVK
jgi:hypothetical protein